MPTIEYGKNSPSEVVPKSAVGIGLTGATGAVILEVLHSGGGSVAISLIAGSTVIIVAGLVIFGLLNRSWTSDIAARSTTGWSHGSPILPDILQNWDQQRVRATIHNEEIAGVYEVLAYRSLPNGSTEALLVKTDELTWRGLDLLTSVVIEIGPEHGKQKQLDAKS